MASGAQAHAGPDFLIIGAGRAGTNWLWRNLSEHPQVWMPPLKELHYFDRSRRYPSPSYLAPATVIGRVFARGNDGALFRRLLVGRVGADLLRRRWELVRWDLAYFLGRCDDRWYLSLFAPGGNRIRGEATPSYSMLDDPDVERIVRLMPSVRVVFVLRDPVERAWSKLRYRHGPAIRKGRMSIEAMRAFVDSPGETLRSDYWRTIDIWSRHVHPARLHIGFYDHVVTDPDRFLEQVCGFLGLDAPDVNAAQNVSRVFNAAPGSPMPKALQRYLARKHLAPIERLAETFGDPPSEWLRSAEAICRGED